jgi:hypothetical protein
VVFYFLLIHLSPRAFASRFSAGFAATVAAAAARRDQVRKASWKNNRHSVCASFDI